MRDCGIVHVFYLATCVRIIRRYIILITASMVLLCILLILVVNLPSDDCASADAERSTVVLASSATTTFSCSEYSRALFWQTVDRERADVAGISGIVIGAEEHLGGSLIRRNLTVTAREEHDGLTLECRAVTIQDTLETVCEVHLMVQGLLSSPGNVHTVNGSSSILLSWTAPFTLDITDVDPDISHYTVYITNLNTRRVGEENVTETEFIFTGLPGEGTPDPCHTYQFRVSAWNVVGEGNRSEPMYGHSIAADRHGGFTSGSLSATVSFEREESVMHVNCSFQVDCPGQISESYMGHITTYTDVTDPVMFMIREYSYVFDTETLTGNVTFQIPNNVVNDLPLNDICRLNLSAMQESQMALNTTFRTFGVQSATVSDLDNSVTVTCRFADGSMVIGCHVKLVPNNGSCAQNQSINVTRMDGQNIGIKTVTIPNGIYSAYVHDHESNGNISLNSAINLTEPIIVVGEQSSECRQTPQPTGTRPTTPSHSTPSDDEFPIGTVIGVCVVTIVIIGVSIVIIVIFIKIRQRHIKKVNTVDTADPNLYVESNPVKHTTQTDRAHRPPQGHASAPLRSVSSSSNSSSGSSPSSPSTESSDVGSPPLYSKLNRGNTAGGHQDQVTPPEDYERVNLQQPKPVAKFNAPQGTQGLTYAALGPARQPAPVRHDQESMPYTQIDFRAMAAKAVHQKSRLSPPVQPD